MSNDYLNFIVRLSSLVKMFKGIQWRTGGHIYPPVAGRTQQYQPFLQDFIDTHSAKAPPESAVPKVPPHADALTESTHLSTATEAEPVSMTAAQEDKLTRDIHPGVN